MSAQRLETIGRHIRLSTHYVSHSFHPQWDPHLSSREMRHKQRIIVTHCRTISWPTNNGTSMRRMVTSSFESWSLLRNSIDFGKDRHPSQTFTFILSKETFPRDLYGPRRYLWHDHHEGYRHCQIGIRRWREGNYEDSGFRLGRWTVRILLSARNSPIHWSFYRPQYHGHAYNGTIPLSPQQFATTCIL